MIPAFLLGVDRRAAFQVEEGAVGAEGHVDVAIFRGLLQKRDVAGVEQVEYSTDEDFFGIFRKFSRQIL